MKDFVFFISWSGIQSKKVAKVIKSVLEKIYQLACDEIFISDENLHGPHWDKRIFDYAANAHIGITCLTEDNYPEPWILAEYGAMSVKGSVCPILFNFPYNKLPEKYVLFKKEMCRSPFLEPKDDLTCEDFMDLLIHLLIDVDSRQDNNRFRSKNFKSKHDIIDSKTWYPIIESAGKELEDIYKTFNIYDYFISRPINGINDSIRNEIDAIISELKKTHHDSIFASEGLEESDLAPIRFENISKCKKFIFIYPKIVGDYSPSSCLLELGAAMALKKEIIFCIQRGYNNKLPTFVERWIDSKNSTYYKEFSEINELSEILVSIINS